MMSDKEIEEIRNIAAKIGERFPDYVILLRTQDGLSWKYSDQTWAMGAAERFKQAVNDQAMIDRINSQEESE